MWRERFSQTTTPTTTLKLKGAPLLKMKKAQKNDQLSVNSDALCLTQSAATAGILQKLQNRFSEQK
jgi:hypothetical protein